MRKLVLNLLVCCSGVVWAQKPSALEDYSTSFHGPFLICSLKVEAESMGISPNDDEVDAVTCVKKAVASLKTKYLAAAKTIKNKKAQAALEEHYLRASAALAGVTPESGEVRISYKNRNIGLKAAADDAWRRFDLTQ